MLNIGLNSWSANHAQRERGTVLGSYCSADRNYENSKGDAAVEVKVEVEVEGEHERNGEELFDDQSTATMMTKSYAASSSLNRWATTSSDFSNCYEHQSFHSENLQKINFEKNYFESNLLRNFGMENKNNFKECSSDSRGSCFDNHIDMSIEIASKNIADDYFLSKSRIKKCSNLVLPRYERTCTCCPLIFNY